jgi:hypothetical protein
MNRNVRSAFRSEIRNKLDLLKRDWFGDSWARRNIDITVTVAGLGEILT